MDVPFFTHLLLQQFLCDLKYVYPKKYTCSIINYIYAYIGIE